MKKRKSRGGARREKIPEVDTAHLLDSLLEHTKKLGVQAAFALGKYAELERQQAVVGKDLVNLLPLLKCLQKVQPSLQYKYSDLVEVMTEVLRHFPAIAEWWPLSQQASLSKTLADCILVLCNHCRRIGRDKKKYLEAGKKLSNLQLAKLEEIWLFFNEPEENTAKLPVEVSPAKSSKTDDLLDEFQVPVTQDSEDSSEESSLLQEAENVQPVPVRKRALREAMALKRPAAKAEPVASSGSTAKKKPATSSGRAKKRGEGASEKAKKRGAGASQKAEKRGVGEDFKLKDEKVIFMPYKTGAVALRVSGGKQLLQVLSKKGLDHSKALAKEALKKLEAGESLGQVRAWKDNILAR